MGARSMLRFAVSRTQSSSYGAPGRASSAYFLAQGLIAPLLVGLYAPDDARRLLRARLDRIFA
ncbi:hypothetical protein ACIB24_22880 [Spongisporangium articulatum]|uniref:Uncharacterized protein n=1 Tax=Spongisporangium articulatum TaxID=3362603 RepID=A0ABW8AU81_9ACTN